MKNSVKKLLALFVISTGALSLSAMAQPTVPFDSVSYTYTEGAFAGAQYKLTFPNGKVKWEGLAGEEKGLSAVEEISDIVDLGDNRYLVTWHESNGLTITAVLNSENRTINAVASTAEDHFVVSGKIDSLK
ncbi:hypothetical protein P7F88_10475 [Vibrio hannami]|uniref:MoaF-related domain-containing protein n=1 Tax=Vibrio hannami TaxID=2717094 RepID=UPI00240EED7E|nr:hypothetical protein [Vibrio hannami]MDG3086515.1 hypothetical protein [Vibrio hannami]